MRRNLEWIEGAPESFEPGMVVQQRGSGIVLLVGHIDDYVCTSFSKSKIYEASLNSIERWAWAIKPHELQWIEDMVNRSNKSRGEQE